MDRKPAVAGTFYPDSEEKLGKLVRALMEEAVASPVLGVVSPHAGYIYSGSVAGTLFVPTRGFSANAM